MITEIREFFKCEVNVLSTTVNLENIGVEFKEMVLYREDDDSTITVKDRRVITEIVRTSEGFKIILFIQNEGDELEDRIDWLIDEDYEIETINLEIKNISKNTEYDYNINYNIGEQVEKEVEIEVSIPLKTAIQYITNSLESKEIQKHIYDVMVQDQELVEMVNSIANIQIV